MNKNADTKKLKASVPKEKNLNRWRALLTIILVFIMGLVVVWAAIQSYSPGVAIEAKDIAIILAPLLAAATAIERFLETIFDLIETQLVRQIVVLMAQTENLIDKVEEGVKEARSKLAALNLASLSDTKVETQLKGIEDQVKRAESLLGDITTQSPTYKQAKRLATIYLSILCGLGIASFGNLQMLHMLGIIKSTPIWLANFDVVLTGVVLATGSGPIHSLINILQQGKEALESASNFLEARKGKPA
jgi:hypothetical protein